MVIAGQRFTASILSHAIIEVHFNIEVKKSSLVRKVRRDHTGPACCVVDRIFGCGGIGFVPIPLVGQAVIVGRVIASGVINVHDGLHGLTSGQVRISVFVFQFYRGEAGQDRDIRRLGVGFAVAGSDRNGNGGRAGGHRRGRLGISIIRISQVNDSLGIDAPGDAFGSHVFRLGCQGRRKLRHGVFHLNGGGTCAQRNAGFRRTKLQREVPGSVNLPLGAS